MNSGSPSDENSNYRLLAAWAEAKGKLRRLIRGANTRSEDLLGKPTSDSSDDLEPITPEDDEWTHSAVLESLGEDIPTPVERFVEDLHGLIAEPMKEVTLDSGPAFATLDAVLLLGRAGELDSMITDHAKITDKPLNITQDATYVYLEGRRATHYVGRETIEDAAHCFEAEPEIRIRDVRDSDGAYPVKLQSPTSEWIILIQKPDRRV